jgi:hypothetical protein
MKKIYLIESGEYSDRDWDGWCSTEEEARRVVAVRNRRNGYSVDEYRYVECECLDGTVEGDVHVGWTGLFEFCRTDDGWKRSGYFNMWIADRHAPRIEETAHVRGPFPQVTRATVYVWQRDNDVRRAERAALDALYAYLAKREGVGV